MNPLSLLNYFEPPEGFRGYFGLICGYDADDICMEAIAERFSSLTASRRSVQGYPFLALMLDAHSAFEGVPGVLRIPLKFKKKPPYRLLHAKVGLLLFQNDSGAFCLRLLVCTGNWTAQTVQRSLDIMWSIELSIENINKACAEDFADVSAAWNFMIYLREKHNFSILTSCKRSPAYEHWRTFQSYLNSVANKYQELGVKTARFFDNRRSSLLAQLPKHIRRTRPIRNTLYMGSGFYEGSEKKDAPPSVLKEIVILLQKEKLLSLNSPDITIIVGNNGCQSVATARGAIEREKWKVCKAFKNNVRDLHAKFLFSAHRVTCDKAWCYIGSGNLTGPGFIKEAGNAGNLEAGVIFQPDGLTWQTLSQWLPISDQQAEEILVFGDQFDPAKLIPQPCPPVSHALWQKKHIVLKDVPEGWLCGISDTEEKMCEGSKDVFVWPSTIRPAIVRLHWKSTGSQCWENSCFIPVVDEFGHIGAITPPAQTFEEAANMLADFPLCPVCENEETGALDEFGGIVNDGPDSGPAGIQSTSSSQYLLHNVMDLVERIAEMQTSDDSLARDWTHWCLRLEQVLVDLKEAEDVRRLRKFGINPFSVLLEDGFYPEFLKGTKIPMNKYRATLKRIQIAWGLENMLPLGGDDV